jgi:hypothetical protein
MAGCVDAAVDQVQSAARNRTPDGMPVQPGIEELRSRQNAVLAQREGANNLVNGFVLTSTAYMRLN